MAWMGWSILLGGVLGLGAALAESVLRSRGGAARYVWATALGASVVLPLLAFLRPAETWATASVTEPLHALPADLVAGVSWAGTALSRFAAAVDPWIVPAWLLASTLVAAGLMVGLLRLSRRSRRWPRAVIEGDEVLLSDGFGPATLGLLTPHIVLPRWALMLEPARRRLVLLHEAEHRRAGDVRLLLAGALAAVATPWNPAAWWQLRRLRAAVEVDCDARVLRTGVSPRAYGSLLLELGSRPLGHALPLSVAALSNPPSLLERRISMIVRGAKKVGRTRLWITAGVALAATAVACEMPSPTSTAGSGEDAPEAAPSALPSPSSSKAPTVGGVVTRTAGTEAMILVDGERLTDGKLPAVSEIERIEVVKGPAATGMFGEDGANGVIQITTKKAAHDGGEV